MIKNLTEILKSISTPVFIALLTAAVILLFEQLTYELYFKDQFNVDAELIEPIATTIIDGKKQGLYPSITPSFHKELLKDSKNKGGVNFQIGTSANTNTRLKVIIKNKNKVNNVVLTSIKMNLDISKLDFFLPQNKDKSYEEEMQILGMLLSILKQQEQIKKSLKTPKSITEKYYDVSIFEYFKTKIDDSNIDSFLKKALSTVRNQYIYFSDKNNYKHRGDIFSFIINSKIVKEAIENLDINYASFLAEFPIVINVNEAKVIELPKIMSSLISYSKDKKIRLGFGQDYIEISPADSFSDNKITKFGEFISHHSSITESIKNISKSVKKMEESVDNVDNERIVEVIFHDEIREILANIDSQYFPKSFTNRQKVEYFKILDILFKKFSKEFQKYTTSDPKDKKDVIGKFKQIQSAYAKLSPPLFSEFATAMQLEILQSDLKHSTLSTEQKDKNKEIMSILDDIINFTNSRGETLFVLKKYPEVMKIIEAYGN